MQENQTQELSENGQAPQIKAQTASEQTTAQESSEHAQVSAEAQEEVREKLSFDKTGGCCFFSKKWVKALIAALVAVALIAGMIVFVSLDGNGADKRAARYVKAYYSADYRRIKTAFHYDADTMFYDMVWTRSQQAGSSWESACKDFGQGYTDFSDADDSMLKALCRATRDVMYKDSNGTYKVTTTAVHTAPMNRDEIAAFVQTTNEKYQRYGVTLEDYIETKKLRKAYRVEVRVLQKYWEDRDPDEWIESVVVAKYKGQWRVLTIFDPDIY